MSVWAINQKGSVSAINGRRIRLAGLIAILGVLLVPHLPPIISIVATAILGWQVISAYWGWSQPGFWLRSALTATCCALVFATVGSVFGKQAGASLLLLMLALKLSEIRSHRDIMLILGLSCLLLASEFIFSQQPWMAVYLVIGVFCITVSFVDANLGAEQQSVCPLCAALKESLRLCLLGLPIMILLFVFFPRISGSIWGNPHQGIHTAKTGLSNQMRPGTISHLARNSGVAMRIGFIHGHMPPKNMRYWRGPVLWHFAHGRWTADPPHVKHRKPQPRNPADKRRIVITLSSNNRHWLIGLDHPIKSSHQYHLTAGGSLKSPYQLPNNVEYQETSTLETQPARTQLRPKVRQAATELPPKGNQHARQLAQKWANQTQSTPKLVSKALNYFRHHHFVYTLNPPETGQQNSIDHFLFKTRKGFCAHYASAFTFLMRAAGVPARVVTGYLGGKKSSMGNYWIVQKSSAHAWSEVWESGQGWVRVDPTAAVAPSRITKGLAGSVQNKSGLPLMARNGGGWLYSADLAWESIHTNWTNFILGYGPSIQKKVMAKLGLTSLRQAVVLVALVIAGILVLISFGYLWRKRPAREPDPIIRGWKTIKKRLERAGIPPGDNEGPQDYASRAARIRPDLANEINVLAQQYIRIRYTGDTDAQTRRTFIRACRRFWPSRQAPKSKTSPNRWAKKKIIF